LLADANSALADVLVQGTNGDDVIDVSESSLPHTIRGGGGWDRISGSRTSDTLLGDGGNDILSGNEGADQLYGGIGNDAMDGGSGDDVILYYGDGNGFDDVDGGTGMDRIVGSPGDDVIGLRSLQSVEVIDGGPGRDVLQMQSSTAFVLDLSGVSVDSIELILGGWGSDTIVGSSGNDFIQGGNGNDWIEGGPGIDTAIFAGNFTAYDITVSGGQVTVRTLSGKDGTDTLSGFESIGFADGNFDIGQSEFLPAGSGNHPPSASPDSAVVPEDGSVAIAVLANDSDPDSDLLRVSSFTQPAHGVVQANAHGELVYSPVGDFNGPDAFNYTADDANGGRANAAVSITVIPVADPPVARHDAAITVMDTSVQIFPLKNDSDPDGDSLSISAVTQPANGGASIVGPDRLNYSPRPGFTGSDTFQYTVTDGTGRSAQATVTVEVRAGFSSGLAQALQTAAEGSWLKINRNRFSDVWTPMEQRPSALGFTNPAKIIHAWSSMAWDPNRAQLIFWGGGHANYSGNEIYRFDAGSGLWERASLPSQVVAPLGDAQYFAVDGAYAAPIAAHTYDNQEFLPITDRFITFGGGKFNCCSNFVLDDGVTPTGPYLWDPSRAGADMVGGTTGSHVDPQRFPGVIAARMWQNRDAVQTNGTGSTIRPTNFVNGSSAYAGDGETDSILVTEIPRDGGKLFRYTIHDVEDPTRDEWQLVGVRGKASYGDQGAGAYDSSRRIYARTANSSAGRVLVAWSLVAPGPSNTSVNVVLKDSSGEFQLSNQHGMDFDEVRGVFVLWDGGEDVWYVTPPETFGATGWQVSRAPTGNADAAPDRASGSFTSATGRVTASRGILGKWKYSRDYDVFFGVEDPVNGDVWVYKPRNWQPRR
jgi:Ca2+-binding RTX toxin-like protein